ncbi:MAG: enoyl-CoA hydratase [Mycobacterium sp.]|nr:enoyl-CoA hydratase [Mycobacterium sp.]
MADTSAGVDGLIPVKGLLVSLVDGVLVVTMDRTERLNSLTSAMLIGIADVMEAAASDARVRVVRFGGNGRGFCAGVGIEGRPQPGEPEVDLVHEANRAVRAITALRRPVVAAVHGPAAGVGVSLALSCDIVLASDDAMFTLAFTKIGLMPDGGASALVAAAIGRIRALRMALLAEKLSAADALDWGLVTAVYPADVFADEVDNVIAMLNTGPIVALGKTKHAINSATLNELEDAFAREHRGQSELVQRRDFREGAKAFMQHRKPTFTDT